MRRLLRGVLGLSALLAAVFGWAGVLLALIIIDTVALSAWEAALVGLFFDLVWQPTFGIHGGPWYTCIALALLWASEPLRREFLS